MIALARSTLFYAVMAVTTVLFALFGLLTAPLAFPTRYRVISGWARFNLWWLRVSVGLGYEVEGRGNIPEGNGIILAKHQSTWETLALQELFPTQVWLLKRELLHIPFFGWGLRLLAPIAIDRSAGRQALRTLVREGVDRLQRGYWVVVFPEGTRTPFGTKGAYHIGGAYLAEKSGYPVIPIAHDAGRHWPRHGFVKRPGTIRIVIGTPIPTAGRKASAILREAEGWIEGEMDRLRRGAE